jgi:dihydrolipoamide dehydrogenase
MGNLKAKICILGTGPAGYVAAIRAAQLGASVLLIEKAEVGGTCLNIGCIPTKALLKTAETLETIKKSSALGVSATISSVIMGNAVIRKDRIVKGLKIGLESLLSNPKITLIRGEGLIESPNKIKVKTDGQYLLINCDKLIIASGSNPLLPNIPGIVLKGVITSNKAINLTEIPASITIVGAGAIGLEFATLFNATGSKVTVVELQDKILPQEDPEITAELLKIMKRQGIKFKLKTSIKSIKKTDNGLIAILDEVENETEITSEKVLIAIGRKLNVTPDIEALGLKLNGKAIAVNEFMETSVSGVYAAGDVIGGKLLAHLAFAEGKAAAENACGGNTKVNYNAVPSCVYTHPEVASVGMTETDAINHNVKIKVGRFNFRNNGRSLCQEQRDGFVKIVVEEKSGIILGAQILGSQASELISELTLAITLKAKAEDIANMIHPHPALSEAIMEACGDALGMAIHK